MAPSGASDAWGPALEQPSIASTSAAEPTTPLTAVGTPMQNGHAATLFLPGKHAQGIWALSTYDKPLGEDPVYLAAMQQALATTFLGSNGLPATSGPNMAPAVCHAEPSSTPLTNGCSTAQASTAPWGSWQGATPSRPKSQGSNAQKQQTAAATPEPSQDQVAQAAQAAQQGNRRSSVDLAQPAHQGGRRSSSELAQAAQQRGRISSTELPRQGSKPPDMQRQAAGPWIKFLEYLAPDELQRGLKLGHLFRGKFRANVNDRKEAFVTVPGLPHDCLVRGERNQNRAMEGDEVAIQVLPLSEWFRVYRLMRDGGAAARAGSSGLNRAPSGRLSSSGNGAGGAAAGVGSGCEGRPWLAARSPEAVKAALCEQLQGQCALRITAQVVAVLEKSPKREQLVGVLQAGRGTYGGMPTMFLLPLDPHMPRCQVSPTSVNGMTPELLEEAAATQVATRTLMSARVVNWPASQEGPTVELRHSLGQAGEIESETAAILEMEGVRSVPFPAEVLACLPKTPWAIRDEDLQGRRDFRSVRLFSIDPPTAKDLDDALSIEPLEGGNWRVGVHIADVAHFIPPFSALDREAGTRSTSVYLVQRVVPMLPPLLCEELCSLNPGVDRFAFSVVWDLTPKGQMLSRWAGRSVIRSCAKLAYPMVQDMIEGCFDPAQCPATLHGGHTWEEVISDCLALHSIARNLRRARFDNGALRLDNVRLSFRLDKDCNPVSHAQYVQREANQLVEEFMLLANMSVADMIAKAFPDLAMLRRHPHPNNRKLEELQAIATELGLPLDVSSAAALQQSLSELRATCQDRQLCEVLTMLATKPMQLAQYFCTGLVDDPTAWGHYALAVDMYTHFTSPIRRYPDVVVHRLLAAALDMEGNGLTREQAIQKHRLFNLELAGKVADHCNDRRLAARNAQDASLKLFLCVLLRQQPQVTTAVVISVGGDRYFSVYLPELGVDCRLHIDQMGLPVKASWDQGSKTLLLEQLPAGATMQRAGSQAAGGGWSRQAAGRGGGRAGGSSSGGGNGTPSRAGSTAAEQEQVIDYASFMAGLPPVSNLHSLQPVLLPLQVRLFSRVPVVVTSQLRPGKISEVQARIFLEVADAVVQPAVASATAAATQPLKPQPQEGLEQSRYSVAAAAAAAAGEEVSVEPQGFCIPWGSTIND